MLVFRTDYALLVQQVEFGSYEPTVTGSNPVRSIFLCFRNLNTNILYITIPVYLQCVLLANPPLPPRHPPAAVNALLVVLLLPVVTAAVAVVAAVVPSKAADEARPSLL